MDCAGQAAAPEAAIKLRSFAQTHQQEPRAPEPAELRYQLRLADATGEVPAREQRTQAPAQRTIHRERLGAELGALEYADYQAIAALFGGPAAESFESHVLKSSSAKFRITQRARQRMMHIAVTGLPTYPL
jgi:hypothetical protein